MTSERDVFITTSTTPPTLDMLLSWPSYESKDFTFYTTVTKTFQNNGEQGRRKTWRKHLSLDRRLASIMTYNRQVPLPPPTPTFKFLFFITPFRAICYNCSSPIPSVPLELNVTSPLFQGQPHLSSNRKGGLFVVMVFKSM